MFAAAALTGTLTRSRVRTTVSLRNFGLWLAAALALLGTGAATADVRRVKEAYTATTTGMTPAGVALRIQVLEWSGDAARAEVIATLEDKAALAKLPTVGYVWPAASPVGYTVKYARRSKADDGRDRITLVTNQLVGGYAFRRWTAAAGSAQANTMGYSVVELYVDAAGSGDGNLSLAADVVVDTTANTVSLASGGNRVLADVRRQPSP